MREELPVNVAAKLIQKSPSQVRRLFNSGVLSGKRYGERGIRIFRSSVNRYLTSYNNDSAADQLWPARWTGEALLTKRKQLGVDAFNREYQNDPLDEEGPFREES